MHWYVRGLSCKPNIYVSWSTSELRVRLMLLKRLKPSRKIFYWPFQDGTSFVDLLCFCSVLCLLCLCARLFICALWSPAGKGLTSLLSFVMSAVSLSLSHWYPGSGMVLDCIDSWSLHPYLLRGGGRGFPAKIFSTMLLHPWFPLIWYTTWPCSKKIEFWHLIPSPKSTQGVLHRS